MKKRGKRKEKQLPAHHRLILRKKNPTHKPRENALTYAHRQKKAELTE